jgi:hypothetical protein
MSQRGEEEGDIERRTEVEKDREKEQKEGGSRETRLRCDPLISGSMFHNVQLGQNSGTC